MVDIKKRLNSCLWFSYLELHPPWTHLVEIYCSRVSIESTLLHPRKMRARWSRRLSILRTHLPHLYTSLLSEPLWFVGSFAFLYLSRIEFIFIAVLSGRRSQDNRRSPVDAYAITTPQYKGIPWNRNGSQRTLSSTKIPFGDYSSSRNPHSWIVGGGFLRLSVRVTKDTMGKSFLPGTIRAVALNSYLKI